MFLRNRLDYPAIADGTALTAADTAVTNNNAMDEVNNPVYSRTVKFQGDGAFHTFLSANTQNQMGWDNNTGNSLAAFSGGIPEIWASCYWYTNTARSPDGRIRFMQFLSQSRAQLVAISTSTGGLVQVRNTSAGTVTGGTNTVPLSTWHRVEAHCLWSTGGVVTTDVWVYDATTEKLVDSSTGIQNTFASSTGCGGVWFGVVHSVSGTFTTGWYLDRLAISDQGPIGPFSPARGMGVPAGV